MENGDRIEMYALLILQVYNQFNRTLSSFRIKFENMYDS